MFTTSSTLSADFFPLSAHSVSYTHLDVYKRQTVLSVLAISVLIFFFFKFCLGQDGLDGDNLIRNGADGTLVPGTKCPVGTVYNEYTEECKQLVMSNKR